LLISIPTSYPTTGPGSSVSEYVATTDIGKHAPAGSADAGYRSTNIAAGPGASGAEYAPTVDPGLTVGTGTV